MGMIDWLRRVWRPSSLSGAERAQAARLGVYVIEASGFDRSERSMFMQTAGVYLNATEVAEKMRDPPTQSGWEDVEYKQWGPRPLLGVLESHRVSVPEARILLTRAAQGEPHEVLPEPLTVGERQEADAVQIYLIWYEDKFHYGSERDSFAISVCLSREEADADCKSKGRQPAESGGDGYEIVGPTPLINQPAEVAREVLQRLRNGMPGPVPIPSKYW
jgi:hypothetical protein